MKILINADDFGLTKSCSDAIYECFDKGLISTTTMVSNGDFFSYALSKIKETPYSTRIGIHINLTEGRPLTEGISHNKKFCDGNGLFNGFKKRYARLSASDKRDVYEEIEAQFNRFIETGIPINHVDSHHHVHNSFRILPIVIDVMKKKNVKTLRIARNTGKMNFLKRLYKIIINRRIKRYSYSKYMGGLDDFINFSPLNKNSNSIFEIMVHPDYDAKNILIDRKNGDYNNPSGEKITYDYQIL